MFNKLLLEPDTKDWLLQLLTINLHFLCVN